MKGDIDIETFIEKTRENIASGKLKTFNPSPINAKDILAIAKTS